MNKFLGQEQLERGGQGADGYSERHGSMEARGRLEVVAEWGITWKKIKTWDWEEKKLWEAGREEDGKWGQAVAQQKRGQARGEGAELDLGWVADDEKVEDIRGEGATACPAMK